MKSKRYQGIKECAKGEGRQKSRKKLANRMSYRVGYARNLVVSN